ncbi:MAG TPA: tetratricopeptide repeat protein, partial [Longimicrobiales bacterium]|nr:tetratricopeptide repeat protein [Longimicrobiales bacterium]
DEAPAEPEEEDAAFELPTLEDGDEASAEAEEEDAALAWPTLEDGDEATAETEEDEAAFELPTLDEEDEAASELATLDGAAESMDEQRPDAEYVVDDIELPTFDTAAPAVQPEPEPEEPDAAVQEDADEEQASAHVAFEEPLLTTDGTAAEDTSDPAGVRIDRSGEAIERVIVAARSAIDRGDVAGAVGRLLSLHQELDDAAAYGRAAEEVGALLTETPQEIRLHQVHVELAERSGDRALRLGAYLSLANALEESGGLAKAAAIYEHVLEIEPDHAAARQALDAIERKRTPQYVDLKSLLELDRPSGETRYFVNEDNPTGDEDRDFAAVLSQFKAKLAEHVSPEDAEAHYDLGLAFKEMGLLDEAIEQFQVALRTGDGRLRVYEELGDCFVQKGQFSVAVKLLERALQLPVKDEMDRVGLYYYLGAANEQLGRTDQARDSYERVLGLDMTFRDVAARLARL